MPSRASVAALGVLLLSGCSSKNPDALNAANVDENYAVEDANATESATDNAPVAAPAALPAKAATNSSEANVDAAVNTLRQAEEDQNEYCEAQKEATGESDCDEN